MSFQRITIGLIFIAQCFGIALTHAAASATTFVAPQVKPLEPQAPAAKLTSEVMAHFHYKKVALDDATSSKIFDNYLKSLDGEKVFLLQSDVDNFTKARTLLDDSIKKEDLSLPFAMYNIYQQRMAERVTYAKSLLSKGFDFNQKETHQLTREKAPWAKNVDEINDIWRKRVKNDWLRLKLAGKDNKSIVETLNKRYDSYLNSIKKVKSDDVFQIFMDAYGRAIDPHTNYFGVRAAEDFNISMKLSLVGIGAILQDKDEYTTIRELVVGGPAALSGKLKPGDRIIGVGQGANSIPVDVTGWRLDDTVDLIRGAEDSVVVLDILPAEAGLDGQHKRIQLVRKKINVEQQAAKKSIIEVKEGDITHRVGVIALPVFYQDFAARQKGDKEFKSATRDVSKLLEELKKDKVEAVILDLRNNGGGSLDEAIELTGLFIDKGPVVQERDAKGKVQIDSDNNAGVAWSGPLGVMINRGSASASEIFAAAMQDYGRGVIIGEQSFGKGTVQSVVDMDKLVSSDTPKFGQVKLTVAQFFRVNGGTTQLKGVTPDISMPAMSDPDEMGESSLENALPWAQIKPANYAPVASIKPMLGELTANYQARIKKNKDFQFLMEDIAEFTALKKKNVISLNEAERRKEREQQEARLAAREKADGTQAQNKKRPQDDGLQANERNLDDDIALQNERKNSKDILLNEAANIMADQVKLLMNNPKLGMVQPSISK